MPPAETLLILALLFGAGATVQWLAWRLRIPAILMLLLTGFLVGPLLGLFQPEQVFGDLFRPLVSLAVGIILFEGGLTLRFDELRGAGRVVVLLCSVGAAATWALSTAAAYWLVGVSFEVALLAGAILVLTGPTVVIPLLRHVRPREPLGSILRWEGILIDPIGAVLAILVLDALTGSSATPGAIVLSIGKTLASGLGCGLGIGYGLARGLERFTIPDRLHVPVTFGAVALAFAGANWLQGESGLLAVTVMGILLANRSRLDIEHVLEWHEQLVTMLLALLFVTIAARLPLATLTALGFGAVLFTAALVLVVRPVSVWLATLGSKLSWRERAFLMAMAPRGIVVAAVSSEFSLHLEHSGVPGGQQLVGLVFPAIVLTVVVYGFAARPFGRLLGVAGGDAQGVLLVGADLMARELALALREQGIPTLLVDTNHAHTAAARTSGLRTWQGSVLSQRFAEEADLGGLGHMLALTPSAEVNRLALEQFLPTFGRKHLYRLPARGKARRSEPMGRVLFAEDLDAEALRTRLQQGARIRATKLTEQFGPEQYEKQHGGRAKPLFVLPGDGRLLVVTTDAPAALKVGCTVLALLPPEAKTWPGGEAASPAPSALPG